MELEKAGLRGIGLAGGDVQSKCFQNFKMVRTKNECKPRQAVSAGPKISYFSWGIVLGNKRENRQGCSAKLQRQSG